LLQLTGPPVPYLHPDFPHLCHRLPLLAFLLTLLSFFFALLARLLGQDQLFILGLKHYLYLVVLGDAVKFFVHVLILAAPMDCASWVLMVSLVVHGVILHLLDGFLAKLDELLAMPGGQVTPVVLRGLVRRVLIAKVEEVDHGVFYGLHVVTILDE
jgi:hypothetical protein